MPVFEVLRNGKVLASTDHECCVEPVELLLAMKAAGYTFRYCGKRYIPRKGEPGPRERAKKGKVEADG